VRERNPTTPQAQECVPDVQRRSLPHPADGGDRTHTLLPVLDFESSASANSATSAFCEEATTNPFATKRKRTSREDRSRSQESGVAGVQDAAGEASSEPELAPRPRLRRVLRPTVSLRRVEAHESIADRKAAVSFCNS
jgi:hypothetical protein